MYSKNSVRNVTIVPCQKTFAQFARTTKPREISSTSPRPSDEIPARRCKLTHPARQIARILFASPCLYVPIPHPYSLSLFLSTCFSLERRPKNLYPEEASSSSFSSSFSRHVPARLIHACSVEKGESFIQGGERCA